MNKKHYLTLASLCFAGFVAQAQTTYTPEQLAEEEQKIVISDGIFREYRLAILLTKEEFESEKFGSDRKKVNAWLKEIEDFLNGIYVRDAGVKFSVVYDDRLIAEDLHSNQVYVDNACTATKAITNRIGAENYDIGVVCRYDMKDYAGLASLQALCYESTKGNVTSMKQEDRTIGHELAHAFGCEHTWSTGSEPGNSGQSLAGYGFSSDIIYLSLASLSQLFSTAQLADKLRNASYQRTESKTNTPPRIDRTRMKREYIIPKNTFFSIPVYATDDEQTDLYYGRAQWDFFPYQAAYFPAFPMMHDSVISFGRTYRSATSNPVINTDQLPVGQYKMLFSVSDALPVTEAIEKKQAPLRDNYLTVFKVVDVDKPFKIDSSLKREFVTGERIKLKWDVDEKFFDKTERVRVLLSDDGGQTFKHVLVPSAPNTGECEVVMPQREIKEIPTYTYTVPETGAKIDIYFMGQAVLRLEMIGRGYYDITNNCPVSGGSKVVNNPIQFDGLPENDYVKIDHNGNMPDKPNIIAKKGGATIANITYTETVEGNLTKRLWVATDGSDEAAYVQWIERANAPITVDFAPTNGAVKDINWVCTFSAPYATYIPQGVTAYYISQAENGHAVLQKWNYQTLPAYQGVLLASETGEEAIMQPTDGVSMSDYDALSETENKLLQNAEQSKVIAADDNAYVLAEGANGLAFYRAKVGSTLAKNKAYLHVASGLQAISIGCGGTVTGINGVTVDNNEKATVQNAPLYDLSGRRVTRPVNGGVYISNGRKLIYGNF